MFTIQAENNNDAYLQTLNILNQHGKNITSRNLSFLEVSPILIEIKNPSDNHITDKKRNWKYKAAKAEFDWYMSGSNLLKDIEKDMPIWKEFSDDGIHIRSAYGYRWKNQVPDLFRKIITDIYTRKAVITLYDGIEDINYTGKDTVCTLSIQFMYRDDQLNMFVNMRSNDLIWGFCNDAFSFTELQKYFCKKLNLKIGKYYHYVASMHIYERHYNLLEL